MEISPASSERRPVGLGCRKMIHRARRHRRGRPHDPQWAGRAVRQQL